MNEHADNESAAPATVDPSLVLTPIEAALREIEQHVASAGWDQPTRLFALIRTSDAVRKDPDLAAALFGPDLEAVLAGQHEDHLTAVEQDDLPEHDSIEELLAGIGYGPAVIGSAIAIERMMVPPEAEAALPSDPEEALTALLKHPQRQDVRLVAGVLRDGTTMCALRQRAHDDPALVAFGPTLVPGLTQALQATLDDDSTDEH